MSEITITHLTKKLVIHFSGKHFLLPKDVQMKIDKYWEELISEGKNYKRGEAFTVTHVEETEHEIRVIVSKTDYAHYLYCQNVDTLGRYGVRIIHTAGPIITRDNEIIFGEMGPHTARPGKYQLCGGGLDINDLTPEGYLDAEHNIIQEFQEEFGVNISDKTRVRSFTLKYLKTGGPTGKMTLIYEVRLKETLKEFLANYTQFEKQLEEKGEFPEFGRIFALSVDDKKSIQNFLKENEEKMDEYLKPFLEYILDSTIGLDQNN